MATEYGFELGGPATADEVAGVFARTAAAHGLTEQDGVRFNRPGADLLSGALVSVSAPSPLPFPHPVETEFGFAPAVHVLFRFLSSRDSREQEQDMIRLVVSVLAAFPGDALLAFAGELVWLLRRGGRLTISKDGDFWIPELMALLPSHDRAHLPTF
jgi:hypothetical protein